MPLKYANRKLCRSVRRALKEVAVPENAAPMQSYAKSELPFYGVKKPNRVTALKPVFQEHVLATWSELHDTTLMLWREAKYREERYAAIDLTGLRIYKDYLVPRALKMYDEMVVSGAWWDLVDEIATKRVGPILESDEERIAATMRKWARGKDMWKRRTSILCQLKRKELTDRQLLVDCMEPSIESKEFFLRKAIGWALRELAKTDPKWVRRYVAEHEERLSNLSKREALKHL